MATPEEMRDSMIANLTEKTGKPLEDWLKIVASSGLQKPGEIIKMLKTDHAMTHGFANLVMHMSKGHGGASADDLVSAQYKGKESLKPIHDAIMAHASTLEGVEISPKKTYVSLRRAKQFALVQPSTKTRMDLGLNMKGVAPQGRLEEAGKWNAMCTHRVKLASAEDVDDEVLSWITQAWDGAQ